MILPRYTRAFLCAVACLLLTALAASAPAKKVSYPTVRSVTPKKLGIGDTMTVSGSHFRKGKNRNTIVFKRDGARAVFIKAPKATTTRMTVVVPAKLLPFMVQRAGAPQPTRFRIRVLASRFGKAFTSVKASPMIGPRAVALGSAEDCDGDQIPNATDSDDDNDLLSDTVEKEIKTNGCLRDTDGDGMSDGWEYFSAKDRNGAAKPAPVSKPYPNALDKGDGGIDHDGDGLTNMDEYLAWASFANNKLPLSYSGGNVASGGRGPVPAGLEYADRDRNGYLSDFERDADGDGIPNMDEDGKSTSASRLAAGQTDATPRFSDFGLFTQKYLEAAETQTKDASTCDGINQVPFYCTESFVDVQKVDTLDWLTPDSDGDSIRDDVDDVDGDDVSNITEYLQEVNAPPSERHYAQLNACFPSTDSRTCLVGSLDTDKDGIANRDDLDDDGDLLPDTVEKRYRTDPLQADTDRDGVTDGFEYYSALDLNSFAVPYPGKKPYPNPLDKEDADKDFDGDGLTLREEFRAWSYVGRSVPLTSYSDGTQRTGGGMSDDDKDVDNDGLTNYAETHGPMTAAWWLAQYDGVNAKKESKYPGPDYLDPSFVDPDTDGDGILDGADDQDHDGYTNAFEVERPANWETTYISTRHSGTDALARTQPFNPCKPIYSNTCHVHPPFNYYPAEEDWASPFHSDDPQAQVR
jgi:hypothetical protein